VVFRPSQAGWTKDREQVAPRLMSSAGAYQYEQNLFKNWANTMNPLVQEIAVQRCVLDGQTWKSDIGHCRKVEMMTGRVSVCGSPRPPRAC
jgi:hypothetical protein